MVVGNKLAIAGAIPTALARPATGVFSASDKQALAAFQRKSVGPDAGDGVFSPQLDQALGLGVFGHSAPAATTGPLVIASLAVGGNRLESVAKAAVVALQPNAVIEAASAALTQTDSLAICIGIPRFTGQILDELNPVHLPVSTVL